MGLGEAFGVKTRKLNLKNTYATLEELFSAIQGITFEAGQPQYVKHGLAYVIAFPQLDRNNQVWIVGAKGKFTVQRSAEPAGLDNMAKNMVLNKLTDGWSGMSAAFGNTKKACMAQVDAISDAIEAAGV